MTWARLAAPDQQMFARTRRGIDHRRRDLHRMRQRDDHAMHADGFCGSQQRSKILRVIQRIEQQDKRRFTLLIGKFKDFDHVAVGISTDLSYHALMVLMEFIEPRPLYFFDGNSAVLCHLQNLCQPALLLRAFCNLDFENLPAFGAQGFIDCIAGVDEFFHGVSAINSFLLLQDFFDLSPKFGRFQKLCKIFDPAFDARPHQDWCT